MPTYEYLCTSCGHEWEFEQSIKAEPLKVCEKCNQETARRQISRGGGFILKGGGWYADLYSPGFQQTSSNGGGRRVHFRQHRRQTRRCLDRRGELVFRQLFNVDLAFTRGADPAEAAEHPRRAVAPRRGPRCYGGVNG